MEQNSHPGVRGPEAGAPDDWGLWAGTDEVREGNVGPGKSRGQAYIAMLPVERLGVGVLLGVLRLLSIIFLH